MQTNSVSNSSGEARTVEAGRGATWWTDGWTLFTKNAGLWIVLGLILFLIFIVLGFIPFIGWLASSLLAPLFVGSWMLASRKVESDHRAGSRSQRSADHQTGTVCLGGRLITEWIRQRLAHVE